MHHHNELSFVDEFRCISPPHCLKNRWQNAVLLWCISQAGPPSLHYYCAVLLQSFILLPPVGHSSYNQYHCCQLTRESKFVSNFYRNFKNFHLSLPRTWFKFHFLHGNCKRNSSWYRSERRPDWGQIRSWYSASWNISSYPEYSDKCTVAYSRHKLSCFRFYWTNIMPAWCASHVSGGSGISSRGKKLVRFRWKSILEKGLMELEFEEQNYILSALGHWLSHVRLDFRWLKSL